MNTTQIIAITMACVLLLGASAYITLTQLGPNTALVQPTNTINTTHNATKKVVATKPAVKATPRPPTPTVVPTPTPVVTPIPPTPTPVVTPTPIKPTPTPMSTKLFVWEGYMGEPAMWLLPKSDPSWIPVRATQGEQCRVVITAANGNHPCGTLVYLVDGQPAGGTIWVNPGNQQGGCSGGMSGGAGGIKLDTAYLKTLSQGWHDFKIQYIGTYGEVRHYIYGPSEYNARFYLVKS